MIALAAFYFSFAWLAAAESAEEVDSSGEEDNNVIRLAGNTNVVVLETKDHSSDRT